MQMKKTLHRLLCKPHAVILVMIVAPILSIADRNYGYFFGLFVALFLLWQSGWDWAKFGFGEKIAPRTVLYGLVLAVAIFIAVDVCIQPFLEIYLGEIDLSSLDDIRGDFGNYLILFVIMWVFAAFGENFLFLGYYMKHLAEFMGNSDKAWLASAIILTVYFGVSHNYQGTAGVLAVALASSAFFLTFYKFRTQLALLVFAHGFYDSIGLTLIYFNKDRVFFDLVSQAVNG